jgi:aldehyde:ferredoxin oxidoreductase
MERGYTGKILWVDLTDRTCQEELVPDEVYRKFISGIGLAAYFLYRAIPPGADPMGPENVLGFVSGLLNGTPSTFTGRWMAVGKSPLTGTWGEANCGGTLAAAIKRSGYDAVFIRGASQTPVILTVIDGKAEIRDGAGLWGLDALETEHVLIERYQRSAGVACIGTSGEKLSLISGISNDGGRMAARSGLGAVMGSKRLKAVVFRGNQKIQVQDSAAMQKMTRKFQAWLKKPSLLPEGRWWKYAGILLRVLPFQVAQDGMMYKMVLQKWGTIGMNQVSIEMGDAPIQNWRGSSSNYGLRTSDAINPDEIMDRGMERYFCRGCALGCGGVYNQNGSHGHKPEYETVLAWSGLLMSQDLDLIFAVNERLNRAGIDSISAGGTIAFALECFEHGILTTADTGGLELKWGDAGDILQLLEKMIQREGIGDILADGTRLAAERIGKGSQEFAIHAGGQELAMHDPRNDPGFALHAVVEPMPGRHTVGAQLYYEMFQLWKRVKSLPPAPMVYWKGHKYRSDTRFALEGAANSQFNQVVNAAGVCMFGAFTGVHRLPIFEWLDAATGWNLGPDGYMDAGKRIQTLKQLFNARQGAALRHTISRRVLGLPSLKSGANRGRKVDLEPLVRTYWEYFGWDPTTGMPTRETALQLGLEGIVNLDDLPPAAQERSAHS